MKAERLRSLEGCLSDYAYTSDNDWDTFDELVEKAAKWEDPQTQEEIEISSATQEAFNKSMMIHFHSLSDLLDWYREQQRGESNG